MATSKAGLLQKVAETRGVGTDGTWGRSRAVALPRMELELCNRNLAPRLASSILAGRHPPTAPSLLYPLGSPSVGNDLSWDILTEMRRRISDYTLSPSFHPVPDFDLDPDLDLDLG